MRPRSRALYEALALSIADSPEKLQWLVGRLRAQEEINRAPLSAKQSAVLQAAFVVAHWIPREEVLVGGVTALANDNLQAAGERFRLSAREVGDVLSSLGVTQRKRTNKGWTLIVESTVFQQLHDLLAVHNVAFPSQLSEQTYRTRCEVCRCLPVR
jgi:hypothetical protein